jgi:putative ATPase
MSKRQETIPLFPNSGADSKNCPLATRLRPRNLDEFAGQSHLVGPGQPLRNAIEADCIRSVIFYGPPGTGKTSLAKVIALQTKSQFEQLVAVESNIKEIRNLLGNAKTRLENTGIATMVFIDEIHRFNMAQQDVLLPAVENGVVKLIGATTENPSFSVSGPLVSRSQIFELKPLTSDELACLFKRALADSERGLGGLKISADKDALLHFATTSDGDARKALNNLEMAVLTTPTDSSGMVHITLTVAENSVQQKALLYREGDKYQIISAYQKAIRGSDADAALYWLATMIKAGEDPRYICRRLIICASEDVGLADSMALLVATAALQAVSSIGWPESKLQLAHATLYVACSPKSNAATRAIEASEKEVESGLASRVPDHLEDQHHKGLRRAGEGFDYKLPHDYPGHFVAQDYWSEDKIFYKPSDQGAEKQIGERVEGWRKQFQEMRANAGKPKELQLSRQTTIRPMRAEKKSSRYMCSNCFHVTSQNGQFVCSQKSKMTEDSGNPKLVQPDFKCDFYEPALPGD